MSPRLKPGQSVFASTLLRAVSDSMGPALLESVPSLGVRAVVTKLARPLTSGAVGLVRVQGGKERGGPSGKE